MHSTLMNCEPKTKSTLRALLQGWVTTLPKKPTHLIDVCLPAVIGRLARNPGRARKACSAAQGNVDVSTKRLPVRLP